MVGNEVFGSDDGGDLDKNPCFESGSKCFKDKIELWFSNSGGLDLSEIERWFSGKVARTISREGAELADL
jgi:hypothetical protein